jgi:ATP-dependent helicase/nuclease subunit A
MLDAAKALGGASAKTFSAKGVELETAMTADDFPGMVVALLTEKGSPRKFGEKIAGIERVREAQDLVLRVVAAQAQDAAWQYQQRMARLARLLLREYAALKRERGWVDMNDVERAAQTMLSDTVLSGWVQERLDARIKHLLIDEFQDTNPLQWQALRSWLSGYAGAGSQPPSVFLVGDPKQSIYRFRRAEPQVFKAAKVFVREGLGGDVLSCDHTRRNATGVIATVNAAMLEASQTDGYEGFRAHTTSAVTSGRVCKLPPIARAARATAANDVDEWRDSLVTPRELPEESLRTLEARQAAQWIACQLVSNAGAESAISSPGLRPADVMVLSRRRASLMPLQDELRKLGMAAQIGEKTELIDCCEVQDLVALLDVLVSKQHDLSLARVLKSPLFGLDDQALVQLVLQQAQPPMPWLELVQQQALRAPDGRSVGACLLRWKAWLDSLPPHDALQNIYFDGDVLARFAAAAPANQREAVQANLKSLLGVSLQLGGGRFATPYALVRALKSGGVLAPAALNPDAVRLLTIHGAKGLEAELVLLLDTDTPERNADTMGVLVDWPGHSAWPLKFVFLASERNPPACAVHALEIERLEREREELNALYVALTRSRNTLVFSSIEPYRAAERSWWQRLSPLALEVQAGELLTPFIAAAAHESGVFCIKELPLLAVTKAADAVSAAWTKGSKPVLADSDSVASRVGQAMHRLLEWGYVTESAAAAAAREFEVSPEQGLQAAAMAQRILQGEAAWAWDQTRLSWHGNEVELMYQGQTLRLDRLVQRKDAAQPGHWWVLDYKSALAPQEQPELVAQLCGYQAAVQAIYPNDVVRAAFLTPQGALLEVTNE